MTELNLKSQVLKLAKGLSKFSIDDILIIIDEPKEQIQNILDELEQESAIKKIGDNQYLYFKITVNNNENNLHQEKDIEIDFQKEILPVKLFKDENELVIYNSLPVSIQNKIYKYILIMKMTSGLVGQGLKDSLKKIGDENPAYKLSYTTFKIKQGLYLQNGIKGLIPTQDFGKRKRRFNQEIYEYFKKLYLHPRRFYVSKCIEIIRENEKFKDLPIPDGSTLKNYLRREYPLEEIKKARFCEISLPEIKDCKYKINRKIPKEIMFDYYIDAVNYYQNSEEYLNKNAQMKYVQNSIFKSHLNPFFSGLKFIEITDYKINDFRILKIKEGLSLTTVLRLLGLLSVITNKYASCEKQFEISRINQFRNFNCERVLSLEQIKKLLETDSKIKLILLFVLSLGLSQAEVLGLDYTDIDYEKRTIKITKFLYKGKIEKYRKLYQKRELHIPDTLFSEISKQQEGRIFNITTKELDDEITELGKVSNMEDLMYEDFITFYVYFLIENNIQVNLISQNLAYGDIRDFLKKYEKLVKNEELNKFDPLLMLKT